MPRLFDPYTVARAFRDPVTWTALIVDLIPIYAVLVFGWGAAPLVFLYWLENLVIGVVTVARMIVSGLAQGLTNFGGLLFFVPFFVVHYGLFCFGHGMGLMLLESGLGHENSASVPTSPFAFDGLIQHALQTGPHMITFVALITLFNISVFLWDFIGKGEYLKTSASQEMMSPYGRIMLLHFALFAGMFALMNFGEPMAGVLALIILRVLWGIFLSIRRRLRLDQKVDAVS